MADVLLARLQRLACDFDLKDNYFAWQAFGRRYATNERAPLPPYLQREAFARLRKRASDMTVVHASFTEHLAAQPVGLASTPTCLLDAQDWMTDEQLGALWSEIVAHGAGPARASSSAPPARRRSFPGACRTPSSQRFVYDRQRCRELTAKDRSSIYGGFHLYTLAV